MTRPYDYDYDEEREYIDSAGFLQFGKHEGAHVQDVARFDTGYLQWMEETLDLNTQEQEQIHDAIEAVKNGG